MPAFDSTQLVIGTQTQYFFDDLLIETVENVRRTFHLPQKVGTEPVLRKDKPWEHMLDISCNSWMAVWDPKDKLFKAWYTDWERVRFKAGEMPTGGCYRILYAYSEDGVHWTKPALGIEMIDGHSTNVVLGGNGYAAYNLGLMIDPFQADESRRFKGLCTYYKEGTDCDRSVYVTSANGIHWTVEPDVPQFGECGERLDDVTLLSYDPWGRIYVASVRHYDMYAVSRNNKTPSIKGFTPPYYPQDWARQNKRRVFQCESADFVHWSHPHVALSPEDGQDDLDATFYGLCQVRLGGIRLGFLNIMNYVHNDMLVRLVYTRDGHNWAHLNSRRPWLAPRGPGFWDAYMNTATSPPIRVGDELYVFHGGAKNHHDWHYTGEREGLDVPEARDFSQVEYCLGLAKMRFDGYCSLEAGPARDGIFVTRPLISTGSRLEINAACAAGGSIAAEVVDYNDDVVPGFGKEQCDIFGGDSVAHTMTWRGQDQIPVGSTERAESLEPERGRIRKLRFYMRKAHLYSLALT
jgi:hypothetical protein